MTRRERFLLGLAAGAAAVFAGSRGIRNTRAISFDGRVVVITGGSRGLGLVMARQLAAEGARLCLLARDEAELERAREQLPPSGDVMTVRCDVRRRADVRFAMDRILEKWTAVDVLINNAGTVMVGPLEHMTLDDFQDAMATHFWGPLHLMFEAVPSMRHRGFGRIVNISSVNGKIAFPHLAPYTASKFALVGLSDAVRAELDQYGIRVTTVCPGLLRSGGAVNAMVKGRHEEEYTWFAIADSTPGLAMSAERAASKIIEACRYGDPEVTLTLAAQAGVRAYHLAPALVGRIMMLMNQALPAADGAAGDLERLGKDSETPWTESVATALVKKAAAANNEY